MTRRRVVITGMGTVNCLAHDVEGYWKGLLAGKSGIGPIDLFDTKDFKVHFGGQVRDFNPELEVDARTSRRLDRYAQFAMFSAIRAVRDSGLDFAKEDATRCGVIIGSGIGGLGEYEEQHTRLIQMGPHRISPFVIPKLMLNSAPGHISILFGLRGRNFAVATACASAANAMGEALRTIQHDEADIIVTGGSEATITPMGLGGFCSARALSTRNDAPQLASRPFDKDRDGFVLAEGAGILIFEEEDHARKRGAKVFAEVLGYGASADAHDITAPSPDGSGACLAMTLALKDARTNTDEIDYVNAHGTSTSLGDEAETKALKAAFGDHVKKLAVSSTKSMIGHLLGASGGVEMIATVMSICNNLVHPTINYDTPDPACDLDYVPNTPRSMPVRKALSNSFGFGGHNASLVVSAYKG